VVTIELSRRGKQNKQTTKREAVNYIIHTNDIERERERERENTELMQTRWERENPYKLKRSYRGYKHERLNNNNKWKSHNKVKYWMAERGTQ